MPQCRMDEDVRQTGECQADGDDDEVVTWRSGAKPMASPKPAKRLEPPVTAIGILFRRRLQIIYRCEVEFHLDINPRPTARVLGGYYKSRRLVRIYSHDSILGPRPLEELFDTFLHEVAHHLEYTESHSFGPGGCRRKPGMMHSRLFWRILGLLKQRWADLIVEG